MKQRTSDLTLSIVKCTQQRFNLRTVTITTIAAFWYKLTFIPWYKFSEDRITAFGYKYGISERCGWFYNCVVTSTPQCSQVHKTLSSLKYAKSYSATTLFWRWAGELSERTDSLTGCRGVRWPPVMALIVAESQTTWLILQDSANLTTKTAVSH